MRHIFFAFLVAIAACGGSGTDDPSVEAPPSGGPPAPSPSADAGVPGAGTPVPAPAPAGPALAGCPMFPADNDWNRDVSSVPVDPRSDAYLAFMGASWRNLHADFGANRTFGIPFTVIPASQPRTEMSFVYSGESDPGPYPFPPDIPIQGGS